MSLNVPCGKKTAFSQPQSTIMSTVEPHFSGIFSQENFSALANISARLHVFTK